MKGIDYSNLDLRQKDFSYCDCRDANFSGSNLTGANFFDANLTGSGLIIIQSCCYTAYVQKDSTRIQGINFTNDEWKSFQDDEFCSLKYDSGFLPYWKSNKFIIFAAMDSLNK